MKGKPKGHPCKNRLNLIGKKFSKLLVIGDLGTFRTKGGAIRSYWSCLCDCGKVVKRRSDSLKSNVKVSCGCFLTSARKDPQEMGITIVLGNYKQNCKKKNLVFDLTREEFTKLILSNCYYCDHSPSSVSRPKQGHSRVIYSGIDRLDNNKGYLIDNVVSCCRDCNYMKNVRNCDAFLDKIKKIYEHLSLNMKSEMKKLGKPIYEVILNETK